MSIYFKREYKRADLVDASLCVETVNPVASSADCFVGGPQGAPDRCPSSTLSLLTAVDAEPNVIGARAASVQTG